MKRTLKIIDIDYDSLTDYNPFGCENIPISKITGGIAIGGQNPDEILEKLNIKDIENFIRKKKLININKSSK